MRKLIKPLFYQRSRRVVIAYFIIASCLAGCLAIVDFNNYDTSSLPADGGVAESGDGGVIVTSPEGAAAFNVAAKPTTLVLHIGEGASLDVTVQRSGGFVGDIQIGVENVPPQIDIAKTLSDPDHAQFSVTGRALLPPTALAIVATIANVSSRAIVTVSVDPSSGSLDPSYGDGGIVLLPNAATNELAFDPKGRLTLVSFYEDMNRFETDGGHDLSFGDGGRATLVVKSTPFGAPTFDDQGRITVASIQRSGGQYAGLTASRYLENGAPETSADGGGGTVKSLGTMLPIDPPHMAATSDHDGRWVLSRISADGGTCPCTLQVERFGSDGSRDTTFQFDGGAATLSSPAPHNVLASADGHVVVSGARLQRLSFDAPTAFTVLKLLPNGQLDPSFGQTGTATTNFIASDAGAITCNEHITSITDAGFLVTGFVGPFCDTTSFDPAGSHITLARLSENGQPDLSFGDAGAFLLSDVSGYARSATTQPDGKLLVVGAILDNTNPTRGFVLRFGSDGRLDPSFRTPPNPYGVVIDLGFPTFVRDVIYADGRIYAAGLYKLPGDQTRARPFIARIVP